MLTVQSLSVVVPGGCPNKCKFCVARMHEEIYPNLMEKEEAFEDLHELDFVDRLAFARDNGCNTVVLTGNGEPLSNHSYLRFFATSNQHMERPFRWIELQTSGVGLLDQPLVCSESFPQPKLRWLRNKVRVSTISLSLADIFDTFHNADIMDTPKPLIYDIDSMCNQIKRYGFNLRLSVNMTAKYEGMPPDDLFKRCASLGADQVTLRQLFAEGDTPQAAWVAKNGLSGDLIQDFEQHVAEHGRPLEQLHTGATRYAYKGMSVVVDKDCMASSSLEAIRYLILRPNCKLYTKWDEAGSILF